MLSQNNAQGAFDMGAFPISFRAMKGLRTKGRGSPFEEAWAGKIPQTGPFLYGDVRRILEGKIKALYSSVRTPSSPFRTWSASRTGLISPNFWSSRISS